MNILITFAIGLVIGIVAKAVMPGKDPGGVIIAALLGIAGAFLARYIGIWSNWYAPTEPVGFIAAVIGAVIILAVYRLLFRAFHHRSAKIP